MTPALFEIQFDPRERFVHRILVFGPTVGTRSVLLHIPSCTTCTQSRLLPGTKGLTTVTELYVFYFTLYILTRLLPLPKLNVRQTPLSLTIQKLSFHRTRLEVISEVRLTRHPVSYSPTLDTVLTPAPPVLSLSWSNSGGVVSGVVKNVKMYHTRPSGRDRSRRFVSGGRPRLTPRVRWPVRSLVGQRTSWSLEENHLFLICIWEDDGGVDREWTYLVDDRISTLMCWVMFWTTVFACRVSSYYSKNSGGGETETFSDNRMSGLVM